MNGSPADGTADRPSTSTGTDGPASFTWRPWSSTSARTLPLDAPATNTSPTRKRAALDEHGRERAAALVELGLDHRAFGGAVGVGLELEDFGLELDRFEQLVEVGLLGRRDFDVLDVAAHVLDDDLVLQQLLADLLRLGIRLIDLVDRDDHRHAGGLGVVDRLDRLRAKAVVGRDHQDDDVGDVGAARAHLREGLVARRVEEGDLRLVGQAAPDRRRCAG